MEEMKKKKKKKVMRSSIKALHNIMINLIPTTPNTCMQLVSPNYFSSPSLFNSIYYTTPSTMSSSSSIDHISNDHQDLDFSVQRPAIISAGRFFFSPSFSKSIMEEAKKEQEEEEDEEEGEEEEEEGGGGNVLKGLFKESLMMTMASDDPYQDFRTSMEEMVEAHGVKEWPHLQELLHCYLKLNEKKTHKVILLAFVDLLMQLMAKHDHDN